MFEAYNMLDLTVSAADNIRNTIEESGNVDGPIFFLGIIVGILVSYIVFSIWWLIKSRKKHITETPKEATIIEYENKEETEIHDEIEEKQDDDSVGLGTFLVTIIVFSLLITIFVTFGMLNNVGDKSEGSVVDLFSKKASNDDIEADYELVPTGFTEAKIQAKFQVNEKIKNLVVRVYVYNESGKLVVDEKVNIGNATPGNEYVRYISLSGFSLSEMFDFDKIKTEVVQGTISK